MMGSITLTQRSQSSTQRRQRISFALFCEYLCDLCVSIRPLRNCRYRYTTAVAACVFAVCWYSSPSNFRLQSPAASTRIVNESEIDAALQQAATDALGQRGGTIIVMDPQT